MIMGRLRCREPTALYCRYLITPLGEPKEPDRTLTTEQKVLSLTQKNCDVRSLYHICGTPRGSLDTRPGGRRGEGLPSGHVTRASTTGKSR